MATKTHQGHPYKVDGQKCIAVRPGVKYTRVLFFDENQPWETHLSTVLNRRLTPLPLRYLNGEYYKGDEPVQQGLQESTGSNEKYQNPPKGNEYSPESTNKYQPRKYGRSA